MSRRAVLIQNLSKKYTIGSSAGHSLQESILTLFSRNGRSERSEFWALKDIDLEIPTGQAVGIIGRNGAGKSTLLKVLSRITFPTSGKITIDGRVSSLLEVGTGFHPELTGRENIFLNGTILGMSRKEVKSKFDEIVAFAGVDQFINTPVKHYSSGMYVRLAFSVAAHLEPEILIIDEVLAVGDAEFQKKCLGKMEEVAGQGRTVLFVSHNMNAVSELCNRVVVISKGNLIYDSTNVQDAIAYYLNQGLEASREDHLIQNDQSWDNDIHTLESISLVSENGQVLSGLIHNTQRVILKIHGKLHDNDPSLNIGFILHNSRQEKICSSWLKKDTTGDSQLPHDDQFEISVEFPTQFFNENHYSLEIVSVLHNIKFLIKPGHGPRLNFGITGGRLGEIINPTFVWSSK